MLESYFPKALSSFILTFLGPQIQDHMEEEKAKHYLFYYASCADWQTTKRMMNCLRFKKENNDDLVRILHNAIDFNSLDWLQAIEKMAGRSIFSLNFLRKSSQIESKHKYGNWPITLYYFQKSGNKRYEAIEAIFKGCVIGKGRGLMSYILKHNPDIYYGHMFSDVCCEADTAMIDLFQDVLKDDLTAYGDGFVSACSSGNWEVASHLAAFHWGDINMLRWEGLHSACENGESDLVIRFIKKYYIREKDSYYVSLLKAATRYNRRKLLTFFLSEQEYIVFDVGACRKALRIYLKYVPEEEREIKIVEELEKRIEEYEEEEFNCGYDSH